jgi:hypothetical protein
MTLAPSCAAPEMALQVQVSGPDAEALPFAAIARLFPRVRPSSPRFERLTRSARVVVRCDARVVGLAAFRPADHELRVTDLALAATTDHGVRDVLDVMLDALEAACLAGGFRRLVLPPPPRAHGLLRRRGYYFVHEGCAGMWVEKTFTRT